VSAGWPACVAWALAHGPVVAFAASLAISPGAHALLAAALEQRLLRTRLEFVAVTVGDPFLALAVGLGVALSPHGVSAGVRAIVSGPGDAVVMAFWVAFGLWQWRKEYRDGYYSREQAFAPTKIWHQLAVYPVLGAITYSAVFSGLAAPTGSGAAAGYLGKAAITVAVAVWAVANMYDRRHAKLGHPPYCWRRMRTLVQPWPADSTTLRWYREATDTDGRGIRPDK